MAKYDPKYVSQLASEIMNAADRIVVTRSIVGAVLGAVIGSAIGTASIGTVPGAIAGIVVGGFLGYITAQSAVLRMRADAQLMLTQLNIELNTRSMRAPDLAG